MLSRIITAIRNICRDNLLHEKWLIAPSLRVGYQWLEQAAKSGQPVMNVHVKTLRRIALDIASPYMNENSLEFLSGVRAEMLGHDIFSRLENEIEYMNQLNLSPRFVQTLLASVYDLRLAGMTSDRINPESFEVAGKGNDIKILMREYEQTLRDNKLIDYAGALRISIDKIRSDPDAMPGNILLLMPENIHNELHGLERDFWHTIPAGVQKIMDVDKPNMLPDGEKTDASMLSFIQNPGMAPEPLNDGTAQIYRARGEVNEVRGIFRQCMEKKIPYDEVEILYTDSGTYLPLIYELFLQYENDGGSIPITFAEGIPVYYSHPARALLGLLSWRQDNFLQSTLVKMLQDHLLALDNDDEQNISAQKLVTQLRRLPIGVGQERYESIIEKEIRISNRDELIIIQALVQGLFECLPEDGNPNSILDGFKLFLNRHARSSGKFDEYCREMLVRKIDELAECIKTIGAIHFDIYDWLDEIIRTSRAGGQGPRAGCIYAAPVFAGGHSGRRYTFIAGLDDTRFPGSGRQDPLLLDHERDRISSGLPTASEHLSKTVERFAGLLGGLRGNVTLSYSCYDMTDDSEKFASSVMLSTFRIISGNHNGDQSDLLKWLPEPVSFSPSHPGQCSNIDEWWLHQLCGKNKISNLSDSVAGYFPHLGSGMKAAEARESERFTHYDGFVPDAGPDHNPVMSDKIAVSANMLEMMGKCPLEFFFRYILGIKPPDEYVYDPGIWLNPFDKGRLLHSVFYEFMTELNRTGKCPNFKEHQKDIYRVLEKYISKYENLCAPPGIDIFEKEKRELYDAVRIFLFEEELYCREYEPAFFEISLGLKPEGEGSSLDSPDPVKIEISESKSIRARGRIDRLDRVSGSAGSGFRIWDYKTGGSGKYKNYLKDPFAGGRVIQNILYLLMAEEHLRKEISPDATVTGFGYFFPSLREHGHRIEWEKGMLAEGRAVLENLCTMIANGCFPHSNDPGDVKYSDYKIAFGDSSKMIRSIENKMGNEENAMLDPFRELRPGKKK